MLINYIMLFRQFILTKLKCYINNNLFSTKYENPQILNQKGGICDFVPIFGNKAKFTWYLCL